MKTHPCILVLLVAFTGLLHAQVDMTLSNNPFQMGQELHQTIYSGQISFPKFSTTGPSNYWDFSDLGLSDSYLNVMATLPLDSIPCPDQTNGATSIIKEWEVDFPNDPYYSICVLDQDSLTIIGDYDNTMDCAYMPNGIQYYRFPFEFDSFHSDNYVYSNNMAFTFNAAYTGWGQITLPLNQTYPEVALFQFTDETFVQYVFYALVDNQFRVVLTLDNQGYYQFYDTDIITHNNEIVELPNAIVKIGANNYQLNSHQVCHWRVTNMLGQEVLNQANAPSIQVEELPTGAYIVQAYEGSNKHTLKIFIGD